MDVTTMVRWLRMAVWVAVAVVACAFRALPPALSIGYAGRRVSLLDLLKPQLPIEPIAISYFQDVLQLSEATLNRIIKNYPSLLSFDVHSNIAPTVRSLMAFGFREDQLRHLIAAAPTILSLNAERSLPLRLNSLKKLFMLDAHGLVELVMSEPFLLTCSVDRNRAIVQVLHDELGFSYTSVGRLVQANPRIAMMSKTVVQRCWHQLTEVLGIDRADARRAILSTPGLLSKAAADGTQARIDFLRSLGFQEASDDCTMLLLRFPALLTTDMDFYLKPNVAFLRESLALTDGELRRLILSVPKLLGYNPTTLAFKTRALLSMFTGLQAFDVGDSLEGEDGYGGDWDETEGCDLIADLAACDDSSSAAVALAVRELLYGQHRAMRLSTERAVAVLRAGPCVLAYRLDRSAHVLGALAVSLGLTSFELSRCVCSNSRLLSLSVDGKVKRVLRLLAMGAAEIRARDGPAQRYRYHQQQEAPREEGGKKGEEQHAHCAFAFAPAPLRAALWAWRNHPIRKAVRETILRNPLVLFDAMEKIEANVRLLVEYGVPLDELYTVMHRPPDKYAVWLDDMNRWRQEAALREAMSEVGEGADRLLREVPPGALVSAGLKGLRRGLRELRALLRPLRKELRGAHLPVQRRQAGATDATKPR